MFFKVLNNHNKYGNRELETQGDKIFKTFTKLHRTLKSDSNMVDWIINQKKKQKEEEEEINHTISKDCKYRRIWYI